MSLRYRVRDTQRRVHEDRPGGLTASEKRLCIGVWRIVSPQSPIGSNVYERMLGISSYPNGLPHQVIKRLPWVCTCPADHGSDDPTSRPGDGQGGSVTDRLADIGGYQ